MDPEWAAPPAAETCLVLSDASRARKGGTLIAEQVLELSMHETMMKDPGSYRPAECRCGCTRLHLHDRRERKARGSGSPVVTVLIFLCAKCFATWRVLPAFLARCLWRTWEVVEATLFEGEHQAAAVPVPERTAQRWHARLTQAALAATQALAVSGDPTLRAVAQRLGLDASRSALVEAYVAVVETSSLLAPLAALLHRLSPGLRLM
jgi:phosphohistidine phosphatase SixA